MIKALFAAMEGEKQGDMEAMLNFCLGIDKMNKLTLESLQAKGRWFLAGADDTYLLGSPDVVFPEVKLHEECLKSIQLELTYPKTKWYIDATHYNDAFHQAWQAAGIVEGTIKNEKGEMQYCVEAYRVPV